MKILTDSVLGVSRILRRVQKMAKVTKDAAQQTALAGFEPSASPEVVEGELEAERGCLVYSLNLRIKGTPGITEVIVDAGTGAVLSRKHESEARESAERKKEHVGNDKK